MKRFRMALGSLAALSLVFCAAVVSAQDMSSAVMAACTKCHNAQRICAALGGKDKAAWDATVTRMMGKGAQLAEKDKPAAVAYLAGLKPGSKPLCE